MAIINSLLSAHGQAVLSVAVKFTAEWEPKWPCAPTEADVILFVQHGHVKWKEFEKDVRNVAKSFEKGWWSDPHFEELSKALKKECPNKVHIVDLLRATCSIPSFHSQLLWHLGWLWQAMALAMLNDDKKQLDNFSISAVSVGDMCNHAMAMDVMLVDYMEACCAASKNTLNFGMSTDKASLCGLGGGVQGTQFSLPGNVVMYAPPQASLCLFNLVVMVLLSA